MALVVKNPPASAGDVRDVGLIPGSGRSPGGGHGNPLQYSCLENPMDRAAWRARVHWVSKSQTWLKQLSTLTQLSQRSVKQHLKSKHLLSCEWPNILVSEFFYCLLFPGGSDGKASACNTGDPGLIPGLGRASGEGNVNLLQYSCLENPRDGGAW